MIHEREVFVLNRQLIDDDEQLGINMSQEIREKGSALRGVKGFC